jgi:hypothetical protein
MYHRYLLFIAIAVILCSCVPLSVRGGFSPVQGPLANQSPLPTYPATMSGVLSGTISVVLSNGEVCNGPWAFVSRTPPAGTATETFDLAAQWDAVYGSGFYISHVLGNKLYARATLTGKGTTVHVELTNENDKPGNTRGVAQDNRGNIFKVSVYN